jgi:hypothetical protein
VDIRQQTKQWSIFQHGDHDSSSQTTSNRHGLKKVVGRKVQLLAREGYKPSKILRKAQKEYKDDTITLKQIQNKVSYTRKSWLGRVVQAQWM